MTSFTTVAAAAVGAAVAAAAVTAISTTATGAPHAPSSAGSASAVNPADFAHPAPNPYFPLTPGLVTRLSGTDEGRHFHERVAVTRRTRTIEGVETRVVHDVLRRADGTVAEATDDWYASDNAGNVWYFGERTATYDRRGHVTSREGSWQAGLDGAVAGLIMPANPKPTDAYRQELRRGHAEDQAWIVQSHATRTVPAGTFTDVVRSYEWSRLEPDVVSVKFYAPGVGVILERDVAGGSEVFRLTSVHGG